MSRIIGSPARWDEISRIWICCRRNFCCQSVALEIVAVLSTIDSHSCTTRSFPENNCWFVCSMVTANWGKHNSAMLTTFNKYHGSWVEKRVVKKKKRCYKTSPVSMACVFTSRRCCFISWLNEWHVPIHIIIPAQLIKHNHGSNYCLAWRSQLTVSSCFGASCPE